MRTTNRFKVPSDQSVGGVNIFIDVQEKVVIAENGVGQSDNPPREPVFEEGPSQGLKPQFAVNIQKFLMLWCKP